MENKLENPTWECFEEEEEDSLSFCNFSMLDNKENSVMQSPRGSTSVEEFFEFFTELSPEENYSSPKIIFCGKSMNVDDKEDQLNEYQKRDYLATVRSKSFRRAPSYDQREFPLAKDGSSSLRFSTNQSSKHSMSHVQKANISSLTSMSAKSRRRMFMFGPVKFKPEMELSAIKERQGRRVPTPMIPAEAVVDGEKSVVSGGGGSKKPRGKSNTSPWGMMRSLRSRSHLTAVLSKSFGCIPMSGVENWARITI